MVVGFLGAIVGDEDRFSAHAPIVERSGRYFFATNLVWDESMLSPLASSDEEALSARLRDPRDTRTRFRGPVNLLAKPVYAEVGDVVWLAGRSFASRCNELTAIERPQFWEQEPRRIGFVKVGSFDAFNDLSMGFFTAAKVGLYRSLFGRSTGLYGTSDTYFSILDNVNVRDRAEQHLHRGLYFAEKRNDSHYRITATYAVNDGSFDSEDAFDTAVEKLRVRLAKPTVRERIASAEGITEDAVDSRGRNWADLVFGLGNDSFRAGGSALQIQANLLSLLGGHSDDLEQETSR